MAEVVFWMPPKHLLLHQTSGQVKKGYQFRFVTDLTWHKCLCYKPTAHQEAESSWGALGGRFPLPKAPTFWHKPFLQPEQRKHWETLRAALKVPHQKSPPPSQGPSSDLLSPAHKCQWPSWPQAPALWLVMPWVSQTWQPQLFPQALYGFFLQVRTPWSRPACSGWSSSDRSCCPCCHQGHSSEVWVHGQVTLWGPNTCKGPFLCCTQQELTHR